MIPAIKPRGIMCKACGESLKILGESDRPWAAGREVNFTERDGCEIEDFLERHQGHALVFDVMEASANSECSEDGPTRLDLSRGVSIPPPREPFN